MFFTTEQINGLEVDGDPLTIQEGDNVAILTRRFAGTAKPFHLELGIENNRDDFVLFRGSVSQSGVNRRIWESFGSRIR